MQVHRRLVVAATTPQPQPGEPVPAARLSAGMGYAALSVAHRSSIETQDRLPRRRVGNASHAALGKLLRRSQAAISSTEAYHAPGTDHHNIVNAIEVRC
jgi:hypothetical protein